MGHAASLSRRLAALVLAVAFLAAAGPDGYGLRPCPHHAVPAAAGHGAAHEAPAEDSEHAGQRAEEEPGQHGPDAPCTCLRSCHGSASVPTLATAPAGPATDLPATLPSPVPDPGSRVLGPRHAPFELHLPNAPPAAL